MTLQDKQWSAWTKVNEFVTNMQKGLTHFINIANFADNDSPITSRYVLDNCASTGTGERMTMQLSKPLNMILNTYQRLKNVPGFL